MTTSFADHPPGDGLACVAPRVLSIPVFAVIKLMKTAVRVAGGGARTHVPAPTPITDVESAVLPRTAETGSRFTTVSLPCVIVAETSYFIYRLSRKYLL